MTWGNPPKFVPFANKPAKKITPEDLAKTGSEDGHQAAVFCWSALPETLAKYPQLEWMHAIPNGGSRNKVEAINLVATGLRSGVWDIFLPCPVQTNWVNQYAGLYIEMKVEKKRTAKDGGLTKEQLEFEAYAEKMGYFCCVCYNWLEARDIIIRYLSLEL